MTTKKEGISVEDIIKIPIGRNATSGRFELDLTKLAESDSELFEMFTANPLGLLDLIKEHKKDILGKNELYLSNPPHFLNHQISNLRSKDLGNLIIIKGIIKKLKQPTTKVDTVEFKCFECDTIISVHQTETKITRPRRCNCGGKNFGIEKRNMIDIQEMEIEENTEDIAGKQPQKIKLLLINGLTDPLFSKFQVGNKVEVMGILTETPSYISGKDGEKTVLEYMIRVIELIPKEGYEEDITFSEEEIAKIKEIASKNPLQTLSDNLAPNIYGLEHIKKAAVLFLSKGVTKETINGERRRGEIHMLVVSDPGLAKSTLLQNMHKRAVNIRLVDGKNTTKAGIVAAMSQNKDKQWEMEAGDMVLANKGYLLLDEADKLPHSDRQALHGPMEQGEAVISKAGVKAVLKANTSIFAAANPKLGNFEDNKTIIEQIDFTSTFLSRFDLIFVMKDNPDNDIDLIKAERMLDVHSGIETGTISADLMKKYFLYISKLKPKLTRETSDKISKIYTHIRSLSERDGKRIGMPITPRHLEGLIRLSEAHAKLRLAETIEMIDVEIAENLFKHSLSDFGIDLHTGVLDMSTLSTMVKTGKRDMYFKVMKELKERAKSNNQFTKKELSPELMRKFGMSFGELEDIYAMLHAEGEIYESRINEFRMVKVD